MASLRGDYAPMAAILIDKVPEEDHVDMKENLDFVEIDPASVASLFPSWMLCLFITHIREPF